MTEQIGAVFSYQSRRRKLNLNEIEQNGAPLGYRVQDICGDIITPTLGFMGFVVLNATNVRRDWKIMRLIGIDSDNPWYEEVKRNNVMFRESSMCEFVQQSSSFDCFRTPDCMQQWQEKVTVDTRQEIAGFGTGNGCCNFHHEIGHEPVIQEM